MIYLRWRAINWRHYLRCGVKIGTFLFWASLYMVVMNMTIFKSTSDTPPVKEDWAVVPDNYTKWLFQGPVLGDDEPADTLTEWQTIDNATIAEIEKRAERVQKVCRMYSLPKGTINNKEFFVDPAHNLVWCNIFKAASSSWLYKFNILGGYSKKFLSMSKKTPLMLARRRFPRPSVEGLRDALNTPGVISLLVVREPFVRLLSAYRDKLETTPPFYRKLAKSIVTTYRQRATKLFGPIRSHAPIFYEFVSHLIDKHKAKDEHFDEHWSPYYKFCTPCDVNFSVIATVETLYRDSAYVIQQLGLWQLLGRQGENKRARIRTVMNKSRDGRNTTALLKFYYHQIDRKMLDDLLEIYGVDFEMFGYSSDVYRSYVRK